MMLKINAEQRTTEKKSDVSKLRKNGFIPAVVYGNGTVPVKITLNKAEFMKLYKKSLNELAFYEIQLAGNDYHTLIKERQIHPVTREILHLDFVVIPPHQQIEVNVPIKYVGTAIGTKEGGVLDVVQRTMKIQCVGNEVPAGIEVDVSQLKVGDVLHINQLPTNKWKIMDNPENALVAIHAKKIEPVEAPTEESMPEKGPDKEEQQPQ